MQWMLAGERKSQSDQVVNQHQKSSKTWRASVPRFSGEETCTVSEGNKYVMIARDEYSILTKAYFVRSKNDTAEYFMKYLVDIAPHKKRW